MNAAGRLGGVLGSGRRGGGRRVGGPFRGGASSVMAEKRTRGGERTGLRRGQTLENWSVAVRNGGQ